MASGAAPTSLLVVVELGMLVGIEGGTVLFVVGPVVALVTAVAALVVVTMT